jgi:hypothetical protein
MSRVNLTFHSVFFGIESKNELMILFDFYYSQRDCWNKTRRHRSDSIKAKNSTDHLSVPLDGAKWTLLLI